MKGSDSEDCDNTHRMGAKPSGRTEVSATAAMRVPAVTLSGAAQSCGYYPMPMAQSDARVGDRACESLLEGCGSSQPQPTTIMTKLVLKGSWNEVKGKLKQKYAQLTDDDLLFSEGKDDELLGRLQTKLGQTKEEVRKAIEEI